jgi:hypothetical protein
MPISVVLIDEFGEELERLDDLANLLHRLLPSGDDASSHYLRFIDWYGDTIFNQLQMEPFLEEWARLESVSTIEDQAFLARIAQLARRCQQEQHLYLKFLGD